MSLIVSQALHLSVRSMMFLLEMSKWHTLPTMWRDRTVCTAIWIESEHYTLYSRVHMSERLYLQQLCSYFQGMLFSLDDCTGSAISRQSSLTFFQVLALDEPASQLRLECKTLQRVSLTNECNINGDPLQNDNHIAQ